MRKPIVATPQNEWHPNFSPDGAFILYLVSEKAAPRSHRLMRVPVGGGPPELVLSGRKDQELLLRERGQCLCCRLKRWKGSKS